MSLKITLSRARSSKRRRPTLRKRLLTALVALMAGGVVASYALAYLGLDTNSEVTVALLTVIGASYTAYLTADTVDHNSANRYGVDLSQINAPDDTDGDE